MEKAEEVSIDQLIGIVDWLKRINCNRSYIKAGVTVF